MQSQKIIHRHVKVLNKNVKDDFKLENENINLSTISKNETSRIIDADIINTLKEKPLPTNLEYNSFKQKYINFIYLYLSYVSLVLCRKSFSFVLPFVLLDGRFTKSELGVIQFTGLIASLSCASYAISKFFSGIITSPANSKFLFISSLAISGIAVILSTGYTNIVYLSILWLVHGMVQGLSWPALASIIKQWSRPDEFATQWGIQCTSMNIACSIGPVFAISTSSHFDWTTSFHAFGTISIIFAIVGFFCMETDPIGGASITPRRSKIAGGSMGRGSWADLCRSPMLLFLVASYFFMFLARTTILDWSSVYLGEERSMDIRSASSFASYFEIGGLIGTFASCYLADMLMFREGVSDEVNGSARISVCLYFLLNTICCLGVLVFASDHVIKVLLMPVAFLLGVGIYAPCSLYSVIAEDTAPAHLAPIATSLVASSSSVGAVFAGLPVTLVVSYSSWRVVFSALLVGVVGLSLMTNLARKMKYSMLDIKKKL